jgi:hypothetical protein
MEEPAERFEVERVALQPGAGVGGGGGRRCEGGEAGAEAGVGFGHLDAVLWEG